jgi:hypothetical protein
MIQEPLTHFLLIGGLIFILYEFFGQDKYLPRDHVIVVSSSTIESSVNQWSMQMGRPPEDQEIRGFIEKHINDEILSREARMLGLDQDDIVIKRRLVQKMEFMNNQFVDIEFPTDSILYQYYLDHRNDYQREVEISFAQIYFNEKRSQEREALIEVEEVKQFLNENGISPDSATDFGDPSLLPSSYEGLTTGQFDHLFGDSKLMEKLWQMPVKSWGGPIQTSYGTHLIFVNEKRESTLIEFQHVRNQVAEDYLDHRREMIEKNFINKLKERYIIKVDDSLMKYINKEQLS